MRFGICGQKLNQRLGNFGSYNLIIPFFTIFPARLEVVGQLGES
jgi:hypothetical protein